MNRILKVFVLFPVIIIIIIIFFLPFICLCAPNIYAMGDMPPKKPNNNVRTFRIENPTPAPLTIQSCYQMALKRSETIAIKREEIEKTEADILQAAGVAIGDGDFMITDFQQDSPKGGGDGSFSSSFSAPEKRERKFVIKQPLFQGFKSLGAVTGAGSLRKQRFEERIRAEQLLFLDVVRSFNETLLYKKDEKTIESILQALKDRIKELEAREKIGRSRLSEVVTTKVSLKSTEAELSRIRGALAIAEQILEYLIGATVHVESLREEKLEPEAIATLDDYLEQKAQQQAVNTAKQAIVVAQSSLWPELSLENNQYVHREQFQAGWDWDLLLKLNIPIFRGGDTIAKVKRSVSDWKEAKLTLSKVKRDAELDVKKAYLDWSTSRERYEALNEAVKAAEENLKLQKEDYSRNLVNNLDVLSALRQLFDSQRAANEAFYQTKTNFWRLEVAIGKTLPTDSENSKSVE